MSYASHDSRYYPRTRHDTYYTSPRDSSAYPRQDESPTAARTTMPYSVDERAQYPSSYRTTYNTYEPYGPRRSAAYAQSRFYSRRPTWPPSPSVEDETESLSKEAPSLIGASDASEGEPPADTRGTVDQEALLDDIAPAITHSQEDRRFVLVSEPNTDDENGLRSGVGRERRRRSVAERGNMAPLKTALDEPPVFTERVSTPYAYSKPQRESTAAPSGAFLLSPDPITPSNSETPKSIPAQHVWDSDRDHYATHSRPASSHGQHDSTSKARRLRRTDTSDDSDMDPDSTAHLRTERKPARYSFVKSDLQREDLRMDLRGTQERPKSRRSSRDRSPPTLRRGDSSASSKDHIYMQSPRSSSSSIHGSSRKARPAPVDIDSASAPRTSSRPTSPLPRTSSPRLPTRIRESPPGSRPSSRGNPRPASPLSFSSTVRPPSPGHASFTDADWHSTFPPPKSHDRSYEPPRLSRYETMPEPTPRIDVHSPSPGRHPRSQSSLPYPVEDEHTGVFMPPEQHYQFDHSTVDSPRQAYPESPRVSATPIPSSPRLRDEPKYATRSDSNVSEEPLRTRRVPSNSFRSDASDDGRRGKSVGRPAPPDLRKPLPTCPRAMPSSRYEEWYTLRGFSNFDVCPTCFEGVFAETEFSSDFTLRKREDKPRERYCDFNSPWIRLAWLLTVKQRRLTLDLLCRLIDITDEERPCPGERELGEDRVIWYGIPEQRDGVRVSSFAICACDKRMIDVLFPNISGYFTRIPLAYHSDTNEKYVCSLRTTSRRFPKYLDLLLELDTDAQLSSDHRPNMKRFVQMARDNAFKSECARDKAHYRKPWHFIPQLPEFTICQECFDDVVWPAFTSSKHPTTIPRMVNKAIQLVPQEDPDVGSSCCLYSPRMRRVWEDAVRLEDFDRLRRKVLDRKRVEARLARERRGVLEWMTECDRGGLAWERAKGELRSMEREWGEWE